MNHWIPFTKKRFRWIVLLLMIPLLASSRGNPSSCIKPIEALPITGDFSLPAPIIEDALIDTVSVNIDKSGITEVPVNDSEPGSAMDDAVGLFSPPQRTWYLKDANDDGWANVSTVRFGSADTSLVPVIGDWNNDNDDTIGLFSPSQKTWYLKDANDDGWGNLTTVRFGSSDTSWVPVVGDWNYDGTDNIGMYSPSQKTWYLKDANNDGWSNVTTVRFGSTDTSWVPVVGDWDGNHRDTIGMFSPSQRTWYLKWNNTDGWTGLSTVRFGSADTSLVPVVGDWDYNGSDTIGLYSPSQKTWYLKDANDDGWSNVTTVRFGSTDASWVPVVGDWPGLGAPSCYELNRAYVGIGSSPTASPTKSAGCPDGEYVSGEAITMTPHIGAGWTFDYWAGTSCPSCSSFNMPSGHHTVTAYYKRLPHNIRVYNDLHDDWWSGIDWGKNNQILWVRIGATCAELFPDGGGTELLYAGEMTTDGNDTLRITPAYMANTSYQEFDITGVPVDVDGSYCVYLKTGWWEYLGAPSYVYQKNAANVLKCDGSCCTEKEAVIKITEPFDDTEIIFASDILPYTWWYESPFCSP